MAGAVVTALALTIVVATATVIVAATIIITAASEYCLLVLLDEVLCSHPLDDSDIEADGGCKDHEDSCEYEDDYSQSEQVPASSYQVFFVYCLPFHE